MRHAFKGSTLKVCLDVSKDFADKAARETRLKTELVDAIITWVDAVRDISSVPLIGREAITFDCKKPALKVTQVPDSTKPGAENRATAWRNEKGDLFINLFAVSTFNTLLHEVGHSMSLDDTYIEDVWTCQGDQPSETVMCNARFGSLPPDDISGIRQMFCVAHSDECLLRWHGPMNWCFHEGAQIQVGDFNGDGQSDLLCHDPNGHQWIALADSSATFGGTSWSSTDKNFCGAPNQSLYVGDFDGDRNDDVLCHDASDGNTWVALAKNGALQLESIGSQQTGFCSHASGELHIGDFDGDGKDDLLCHDKINGDKWVRLGTSLGAFQDTSYYSNEGFCGHGNGRLKVGNFDGKGGDDLLCHDVVDGHKWVALADGKGGFNIGAATSMDLNWCTHRNAELAVGDVSGDGQDDMVCFDKPDGHKFVANAHDGTFLGSSRRWDMNWCVAEKDHFLLGDMNNDGTQDFICHSGATGDVWIAYQVD